MSTRAVYTFYKTRQEQLSKIASFYIHTDGYPEGCARYLRMALDEGGYTCLGKEFYEYEFVNCFYRANRTAELIEKAERHMDLSYRYDIDVTNKSISIESINPKSLKTVWMNCGTYTIEDFLQKYDKTRLN